LLYSVGQNGQNDAGRTYADSNTAMEQEKKPVDWDDLSLRVPNGWQPLPRDARKELAPK